MTLPQNIIRLGRILKSVNCFELTTFLGRLRFQKMVYLVQVFGLPLGYRFNWYLHGPYSPDLTRDGFALLGAYGDLQKEDAVNEEKVVINRLMSWLGQNKYDNKWLSLVSSIHFLKSMNPRFQKEKIFTLLRHKEPELIEDFFDNAWQTLELANLI